jgi:hypothetical protein
VNQRRFGRHPALVPPGHAGPVVIAHHELGETRDRMTIWRLIAHAHSLGTEKSVDYFAIPRHDLTIPKKSGA